MWNATVTGTEREALSHSIDATGRSVAQNPALLHVVPQRTNEAREVVLAKVLGTKGKRME